MGLRLIHACNLNLSIYGKFFNWVAFLIYIFTLKLHTYIKICKYFHVIETEKNINRRKTSI